ncbi:MAG: hypothetical protein ACK5LZ_05520 [Anaerorhabdus sp.]
MENYYQEVLDEISNLIDDEKWDQANILIHAELKMPYIPFDVEKKLGEYFQLVKENTKSKKTRLLNEEDLETYLFSDEQKQLLAANQLDKLDLRMYSDDLKRYFAGKPYLPAALLLIDSCIRQELKVEFTLNKDGDEIVFIPNQCTCVDKSESILQAVARLEDLLGSTEPSLFELCKTLIFQWGFEYLPLSYAVSKAKTLAFASVLGAMTYLGREKEFELFFHNHKTKEITWDEILAFWEDKSLKI